MGLEGVPGTGKTEIVKALGEIFAAHLKAEGISETWAFETFVGPQMLPEDVAGIGFLNTEKKALERYPLIGVRNLLNAKYGIAFFDELTATSTAVGGSSMTAVQSGIYGDTHLPGTVAPLAAWNPVESAAGGRDLSAPEINRFCKLKWKLSDADFINKLMGGKGALAHAVMLDADWEERFLPHARALVASFLKINPKYINTMESGETTEANSSEPWASQRQWSNATRALAAVLSLGHDPNSELAATLVKGLVGDDVGRFFIAFVRTIDLPDPNVLLEAAMEFPASTDNEVCKKRSFALIPESVMQRPDKLKICLDGVAHTAQQDHKNAVKRYVAAWEIVYPFMLDYPDMALEASQILAANVPKGAPEMREEITALFRIQDASGSTKLSRK